MKIVTFEFRHADFEWWAIKFKFWAMMVTNDFQISIVEYSFISVTH